MVFLPIYALLLLGAQATYIPRANSPSCKRIPSSPDWPSTEIWARLNDTVRGRLLQPSPPGAVCHSTQPAFASEKCTQVRASWEDEFFHSNNPISVDWNNWTNDTCPPDPDLACSAKGYPIYVINATTAEHVKAGVDFARQHNIRLIIKNSGHDYVGRSTAPNSLSIWVHHMKSIVLHEKQFIPKNCSVVIDGPAVTAGSGSQMMEVYEATAKINHTVVGGNGRTVALGGFISGAGHSLLAPKYGLAADQVLEMEIVTPKGEILTLNECQNTDLFWAMRGGGASTFGVLISVTSKIFPSPQVLSADIMLATVDENQAAFDWITYLVKQFPTFSKNGISGYPVIFNSVDNFFDGSKTKISGLKARLVMLDTDRVSDLLGVLQPPIEKVVKDPAVYWYFNVSYYPDWNSWFKQNYDTTPMGHENVVGSRLLDEKSLTADDAALKTALKEFSAGGEGTAYIVSGTGVHNAKPRGGSNAVLPAWRKAIVHATVSVGFTPQNETARADAIALSQKYVSALRRLNPDSGAYMNEASKYEPNWQDAFWGSNYARLLKIKREIDPDDVLWCTPCVGSEGWEETGDGKLCRV